MAAKLSDKMIDKAIDKAFKRAERKGKKVIANLCARFGKTKWALRFFGTLNKKLGTNVMMLPAYWLSVHSSFTEELNEHDEFLDIVHVDTASATAEEDAMLALADGKRLLITISLHGKLDAFTAKHSWFSKLDKSKTFVFADEGDFGTHTDSNIEKMDILLGDGAEDLVEIYASGTNVQRLAKGAGRVTGVVYTTYSELEATETTVVKRKFFGTNVASLADTVEQLGDAVQPNWAKIWGKPMANKVMIEGIVRSMFGLDINDAGDIHNELNISYITQDDVRVIMLYVSPTTTNAAMNQIGRIAETALGKDGVVTQVLNGDNTTNKKAQKETEAIITRAQQDGKNGLLIISNSMGSRSYSVPQIQAAVMAYDRGSVDATGQKTSRPLTPTKKDVKLWDGRDKEYGYIVDFAFDPNRNENIEKLIIEEAVSMARSGGVDGDIDSYQKAVKQFANTSNYFRVGPHGEPMEVTEAEMFGIMGSNENLLKVADITVDVDAIIDNGLMSKLMDVNVVSNPAMKKLIAGENSKTKVVIKEAEGERETAEVDYDRVKLEKILNEAIKALNKSATSVAILAGTGESYRACIELLVKDAEFVDMFGVDASVVLELLEVGALNEAILDVIVQNSKAVKKDHFDF